MDKKAIIFSFTDKGCVLGRHVTEILSKKDYLCNHSTTAKLAERYGLSAFESISKATGEVFKNHTLIVFVGACGIAVRSIAPYIKDKTIDPAVIVIDDNGKFVIPILSGHIGGANAMALIIAERLRGLPIITTATDINGKFSPDAWAAENGLTINDRDICKAVSAAILTGDIPVKCDFNINGKLPNGLTFGDGTPGIYISYKTACPFEQTLRLIPRVLHVGIGCRKNTSYAAIHDLLVNTFINNGWALAAVKSVSSIDIKREEKGLLELCDKLDITPLFYSAEELEAAQGQFTPSAYVKSVTGVDNVCERAAVLSSGGNLILRKTAYSGVTLAVALENWEAVF